MKTTNQNEGNLLPPPCKLFATIVYLVMMLVILNKKLYSQACPTSPPCPNLENKTIYSQYDPVSQTAFWDETTTVFCSGEKITIHALFSPNISLTTSSMFYNDFNFRCDGNRLGQLSYGDYIFGSTNRFNYIGDDVLSANNPWAAVPRITGYHNFYDNINTVFGTYNPDQTNSTQVNPVIYWHHLGAAGAASKLQFIYKENTAADKELACIEANGNMGINTTNPLSKLEVKGGLMVTDQTSSISAPSGFIYASGGIHMGSESFINSVAGNTYIATYPGTKTALGLNNPAAYLHLHALNTGGTDHFKITTNATGDAVTDGLTIDMNGLDVNIINKENGDIRFYNKTNEIMRLNDNSDVIINGSTAHEKLTVYGNAAKNSGGNTWATFSDLKLKKNISPFIQGLDDVLRIKPVEFNYNGKLNTNTRKREVGVIAQDLLEVAPYMVEEYYDSLFGNFYAVNNGPMVYMLINAIKELNNEITELKSQINNIKYTDRINLNNETKNKEIELIIFPNPASNIIKYLVICNQKDLKFNLEILTDNETLMHIEDLKEGILYDINLENLKLKKESIIYFRLNNGNKTVCTKKILINK